MSSIVVSSLLVVLIQIDINKILKSVFYQSHVSVDCSTGIEKICIITKSSPMQHSRIIKTSHFVILLQLTYRGRVLQKSLQSDFWLICFYFYSICIKHSLFYCYFISQKQRLAVCAHLGFVGALRTTDKKVVLIVQLECVFLQSFLKIIQRGIEYMTGTKIVSFK